MEHPARCEENLLMRLVVLESFKNFGCKHLLTQDPATVPGWGKFEIPAFPPKRTCLPECEGFENLGEHPISIQTTLLKLLTMLPLAVAQMHKSVALRCSCVLVRQVVQLGHE